MSKKALLAAVLPFITNPVVLAVVGIGAIGLIISGDEEEKANGAETVPDGSEPYDEPLNAKISTVPDAVYPDWGTVERTVEETVQTAVLTTNEPKTDEELKKEMIRQTMSELGKRSAAARAKKKNDTQFNNF